jgi:hypothetical protein
MRPDELEGRLRGRIDALGPLPAPSFSPRPDAAGLRAGRPDRRVLGLPGSRAFAELLTDCEEDRTLRAVLIGMLLGEREAIAARAPTRLI